MSTKPITLETKGVWFATISGLMYGLLGYFGVSLMHAGVSVYNLSFWRFFLAFVLVGIAALVRRNRPFPPLKTALITMVNGALFYSGSGICFFLASNYIGTGQAMVTFFIHPIWLMSMNWYFLGQPFRRHYLIAFVLIIIGLIFLVDMNEFHSDFLGICLSILASFCYAIYIFFSKRFALDPIDSTLLVSFGCAVLGIALACLDESFMIPTTMEQWSALLGLTVVCTAIPIVLMLEAMKYLTSEKASLLSVLEPVFTVVFGVILLHEVLTTNTVLGMALTLLGAMLVIVRWPSVIIQRLKKT